MTTCNSNKNNNINNITDESGCDEDVEDEDTADGSCSISKSLFSLLRVEAIFWRFKN